MPTSLAPPTSSPRRRDPSLIEPATLSNPKQIQGLDAPQRAAVWIGTAGGFGYAPVAPGTFGSGVGVVLLLACAGLGASVAAYAVLGVGVALLGLWSAGRCEEAFGQADDGRIVIDEVSGQLIALAPLLGVEVASAAGFAWVVTGFVAFRVFDIWKPGPVRWAERRFQGGLGVMADDWLAGAMAAVLLAAVLAVAPASILPAAGAP